MTIYDVRHKPTAFTAVQWIGTNEDEIRRFIQDDTMLRFTDGGVVKVWNQMDASWIDCPVFHYILMDKNRNLMPVSPECFASEYSEYDDDKAKQEELEAKLDKTLKQIDE